MKLVVSVVSWMLLALSAAAQSEVAAVRRFKATVREGVRGERLESLQAVAAFDSDRVVKALVDAYVDLEPEAAKVRERRAKFLARGGGSKLLRPLRHELQAVRDVQDAILATLGNLRSKPAMRAMQSELLRAKRKAPWTLKIALAERAGDLDDVDVGLVTAAVSKSKATDKTLLMLRALAPLGARAEQATMWVIGNLEHADEEVRAGAATALAAMRAPASLEPLIARLESATMHEREAVLDSLVVLTGQNPGVTASAWRLWFRAEGAAYLNGDVPLGRGDRAMRDRAQTQGATSGSYLGIPQTGRSIVYVFDNSLTMRSKMRDGGETRWERCKLELHRALRELRPEMKFNLIAFANLLRVFDERMLDATPANLERAHAWIDGIDLEYETNSFDALELAFQFAGRGVADRYYEPEVDTIFFLSDGVPTWPKRTGGGIEREPPGKIHAAVRRWNPLRRVTIHAIGLRLPKPTKKNPDSAARAFMRELAAQNGGRFVEPK